MRVRVAHRRPGLGRPRGVRIPQVVGGTVVLVVLVAVVLPVCALIGSTDAAAGGAIDVPAGRIALVSVPGLLVVLSVGVGLVRTVSPAVGWCLVVAVGVVALAAGLYPLLATAQSAVDQAGSAQTAAPTGQYYARGGAPRAGRADAVGPLRLC